MDRIGSIRQSLAAMCTAHVSGASIVLVAGGLVLLDLLANVGATTGFALSGRSDTFKRFLLWQLIGSAFGLATQLTFAGMVRVASVQVACAIGTGVAFVASEVFSAYAFFRERFSSLQWWGVASIFIGLMFLV